MAEFIQNIGVGIVTYIREITAGLTLSTLIALVIYIILQRRKNKKITENTNAVNNLNASLNKVINSGVLEKNNDEVMEKITELELMIDDQHTELDTLLDVVSLAYQNIKCDEIRLEISNIISNYKQHVRTSIMAQKEKAKTTFSELKNVLNKAKDKIGDIAVAAKEKLLDVIEDKVERI